MRDRHVHLRPLHVGRDPVSRVRLLRRAGQRHPARATTTRREVRFEIEEQELDSYLRAADFLNFANADIVCLQHEYGIFGGPAGSHIVRPAARPADADRHHAAHGAPRARRRPAPGADADRRAVGPAGRDVRAGPRRSSATIYDVPEAKIDLIAHGIPDMPFVDPNFYKDQFGVEGKFVALTFGLLSPNKGIEHMLRAMPEILKEFPNFVYIVLGATHPNLVREQGERYRISLERLAKDLGIKHNVSFYNRFVEIDELIEFIGMADIYVTPYLNPAQITSGTLAYSFGCGKAVVSTPYWHAEELLADGRGVLVPFGDSKALAREICELLRDEPRRHAMRKKAYMLGREMIWSHVAHLYMESFQRARRSRLDVPYKPLAVRTLAEQPMDLPGWRLDHLVRMTDSAGILQHASSTIPNFAEGYCTDDNARALLLDRPPGAARPGLGAGPPAGDDLRGVPQLRLRPRRGAGSATSWASTARWLEEVGSDDCHGRALWALGACVGRSRRRDLQFWASQLFDLALPAIAETTSPRAWAFGLLGVCLYLERFSGARPASQVRDALTERLIDCLDEDGDRRLALVRGRPDLRQRQAAPRPDRQRRDRAATAGPLDIGPAIAALAGRSAEITVRLLPADRLQRLLPPRRRAGPVRPAADRGQRDRLGLPRGLPRHRGPGLAPRGPAGLRVVPGRQRPGAGPLRRQDRRLLRRPSGRPPQPEPGGRVDPRVPAGPGRDEAAGKHPGDFPPGAGQLDGSVLVRNLCFS